MMAMRPLGRLGDQQFQIRLAVIRVVKNIVEKATSTWFVGSIGSSGLARIV
jgi:hypothetical protein